MFAIMYSSLFCFTTPEKGISQSTYFATERYTHNMFRIWNSKFECVKQLYVVYSGETV